MEPTLAAESVKRVQQRLIAEEALTQDNPQILCERTMYKTAYPGHPYARYPTSVSLKAITKKALRAFQAQRLAKDQLIVVIGGDITAQEAVTCVDQVFGTLPEKAASLEVPFVAPQRAPKDVHIQKFMPQSLVFWYQAGISPSDPDFFPLLIANRILSGGLQSRLYKKLRMEEGLIYFVNTLLGHYAYAEQFFGVTRTESLNKVIEIIRQEWRTMVDKGVTEEELTAATKYLNGSFVLSFTDYRSIVSLLRDYALWGFSPDIIATRADKIQAVTCAAINNAIKQHFTPEALTFVSIGP
jgi:zinc protease